LFLLPIASDFNRILPGVILNQQSATPAKALKFTLACPIMIYVGQHWQKLYSLGGLLAIPDRLDQELTKRFPFELDLPEHIEHLTAKSLPSLFQLFE
jgi:hypothetical protein